MRADRDVQHTIPINDPEVWEALAYYQQVTLEMTLVDEQARPIDRLGSRKLEMKWYSVGCAFLNVNSPEFVLKTPTLIGGWVLQGRVGETKFAVQEFWRGPQVFSERMVVKIYSLRIIPGNHENMTLPVLRFPDVSKI